MQKKIKDDTISRQAAIDTIHKAVLEMFNFCDDIIEEPLTYTEEKMLEVNKLITGKIRDLPSAQSESIRINLNAPIKVKLTDWGKEIYYHQYDKINQIAWRKICKPKFPKEDENGYTEFQLWCFIELYGEHIGMALPNVIEPLEIVYEG